MKTKKTWLGVVCAAVLVTAGGLALGQNPAGATFPGDNGKIVFELYTSGGDNSTDDIFTIDPDGGDLSQVTAGSTERPAWSADGSKIAYDDYSDNGFEIWVMNADGSDAHQVTHCGDDRCFSPTWSPDGTQIAYDHYGASGGQIWVVNADGTDPHALTNDSGDHYDPQWSPDGTKIAYVDSDGTDQIVVMNADGTDPVRITSGSTDSKDPNWSPDGTRIAFTRELDGDEYQVMIMNADGSDVVPVTDASNGPDNEEPVWSPDGTMIAYVAWPEQSEIPNIWIIDVDGTNARQVTYNDTDEIYSPDWQAIPNVTPPSSPSTSSTTSTSVAPTSSEAPTTTTGPTSKPAAQPATPVEGSPTYTG